MVRHIGYMMFGIGIASLLGAALIDNSSNSATANVIASNPSAFGYVEALLFCVAAASLVMGIVFLRHAGQN